MTLLTAILILALVSLKLHAQTVVVSIPSLEVEKKERVVGFEMHVTSGRISKLPNIPIGWNLSVDNDPSWNTSIKATTIVGAAALDPAFFKEFVAIERNESLGIPFEIRGEIIVTKDFENERQINLTNKSFALKTLPIK